MGFAPGLVKWFHIVCPLHVHAVQSLDPMSPLEWLPIPSQSYHTFKMDCFLWLSLNINLPPDVIKRVKDDSYSPYYVFAVVQVLCFLLCVSLYISLGYKQLSNTGPAIDQNILW